MNSVTIIIHYFGLVCLVASLLLRILPAPEEIAWKPYTVLHGVVVRASLNTPVQTGGSNANPSK